MYHAAYRQQELLELVAAPWVLLKTLGIPFEEQPHRFPMAIRLAALLEVLAHRLGAGLDRWRPHGLGIASPSSNISPSATRTSGPTDPDRPRLGPLRRAPKCMAASAICATSAA